MSIDVATSRPSVMDAIRPVMEQLAAAGIRVTLDIAQLNPPGCILLPPELDYPVQRRRLHGELRAVVTVGSSDRTRMIVALSDFLPSVLQALGDRPITARPVDVTLADASTVLPGYELRWSTRIRHR